MFDSYQESFFALHAGHKDWAIVGTDDSDIPGNLRDTVVDKVFSYMEVLDPDEDAPQAKLKNFSKSIENARASLKDYRDKCCPRRQSKRIPAKKGGQ